MSLKLKENRDYRRAYARGRCSSSPVLVTYAVKKRGGGIRFGITTSKKIGNAVARNRARRVITAAWRSLVPLVKGDFDIVFVARTRTTFVKSTEVAESMREQLRNAGIIHDGVQQP